MAAGYDRKVDIGKVFEIDAKISFYEYTGTLSIGSTFCEPKKRDEISVDFVNILYVVPVSSWNQTKKQIWKVCARKCDGEISCMGE